MERTVIKGKATWDLALGHFMDPICSIPSLHKDVVSPCGFDTTVSSSAVIIISGFYF